MTLAQDLGKGNAAGRTSRVRLHEIGPRLEMEVVKVWLAVFIIRLSLNRMFSHARAVVVIVKMEVVKVLGLTGLLCDQ